MFEIEIFPNFCYVSFETSVRGIKITKYLHFDRTWRQITNHEWLIPKLIQNGAKERIWHRRTKEDIVKYVENVLGIKLLDYQKIFLRKAYEAYIKDRNAFILIPRLCGKTSILRLMELFREYKEHVCNYPSYVTAEESICRAGLECDTVCFTIKNCPKWVGKFEREEI